MRPASGAVIWVNSRLSWAPAIWAWAVSTAARPCAAPAASHPRCWPSHNRPCAGQHPGELGRRPLHPRLRLRELRLGGIEVDLIGPRIDDEEQIALLDQLAVREMDLRQIAADPGANLDVVDRLELAGELVPFGDGLLQGMADGDRRRLGGCCGGGLRHLPRNTIIVEEDAGHGGHQQDRDRPAGTVAMARGCRRGRRRGCARTRGGRGIGGRGTCDGLVVHAAP